MSHDDGKQKSTDGGKGVSPLNVFAAAPNTRDKNPDPLALAIQKVSLSSGTFGGPTAPANTIGKQFEKSIEQKEFPENRVSELIASGIAGENFRKWVKENNTNIMLLAAAPAYLALSFANSNPFEGSKIPILGTDIPILGGEPVFDKNPYLATGLTVAAPLVLNDVTENFIKAIRYLNEKGIISDKKLSAIGAASHTGSEIVSAAINSVKGAIGEESVARQLAINLSSTFTANVSHFGTMFFGTAAFYRMGFTNKDEWFAHARGIAGTTAGLGVPVLADAGVQAISEGWLQTSANVANRVAGAGVSIKYGTEYLGKLDEFGDECPVCGTIHGSNHDHADAEPAKIKLVQPKKEPLCMRFTKAVRALPTTTKDYVQSIPQRMREMPSNAYATLKNVAHTSKLMVTDRTGRDAIKSIATGAVVSYGMLNNLSVIEQGFALTKSSSGALHGIVHSLPETLFMFKAAAKGENNMAIGAFGGCVASMGILGGVLLASGADIGETMRSGLMQATFYTPALAALIASHEDTMKWVAVPATALAIAASVAISSNTCHTHFDGSIDCGNNLPSVVTLE